MNKDIPAALSALSTGLYLLTTGTPEEPYGMIVSWVSQVSFDPPLVAVAVRTNRFLHDLIPRFGCFGLNVLADDDEKIIGTFKQASLKERFREFTVFTAVTGAPLLKEALACLDCRLYDTVRPGDHSLYVGRVEDGRRLREGAPMTSLDYGHTYLGRY